MCSKPRTKVLQEQSQGLRHRRLGLFEGLKGGKASKTGKGMRSEREQEARHQPWCLTVAGLGKSRDWKGPRNQRLGTNCKAKV